MSTALFDVVIRILAIIGSLSVITFFGLLLLAWRADASANERMEAEREAEEEEELLWSVTGDGSGERLPDFNPEIERLCVPMPHALASAATAHEAQTAGTDCHGEN
jgi:hypothetical protein